MSTRVDAALVEEALAEIRPALLGDGGDVMFRGVDDEGVVTVELLGACGTCPLQVVTMAAGIEILIQRRVHRAVEQYTFRDAETSAPRHDGLG